jgi:hypothetical protein
MAATVHGQRSPAWSPGPCPGYGVRHIVEVPATSLSTAPFWRRRAWVSASPGVLRRGVRPESPSPTRSAHGRPARPRRSLYLGDKESALARALQPGPPSTPSASSPRSRTAKGQAETGRRRHHSGNGGGCGTSPSRRTWHGRRAARPRPRCRGSVDPARGQPCTLACPELGRHRGPRRTQGHDPGLHVSRPSWRRRQDIRPHRPFSGRQQAPIRRGQGANASSAYQPSVSVKGALVRPGGAGAEVGQTGCRRPRARRPAGRSCAARLSAPCQPRSRPLASRELQLGTELGCPPPPLLRPQPPRPSAPAGLGCGRQLPCARSASPTS